MGFIYSFDMSKEIAHFKRMPEDVQASAECNAVSVIYESFVVPADQDYLTSRLLAQNGLPRGFFWAAAQATEKYLKAFLLMNDHGVTTYQRHPIKELYKAACKLDPSLAGLSILPHKNIKIEARASHLFKMFAITDFIEELEIHGSADNRYNALGVEFNTGHLCAMDSLSFQLRRKIGVISINESLKKLSPDLIIIFKKNNPWFNEVNQQIIQCPSNDFPIRDSSSVTKLEFLIHNKNNPAYGLALKWLKTKMKLPKKALT